MDEHAAGMAAMGLTGEKSEELSEQLSAKYGCSISVSAPASDGLSEAAVALKDEGNKFFKDKNYLKAAAAYKKATAKDPTLHTAYSNLSAALLQLNKFTQALEAAEACLRLQPDFTKAAFRKGQALLSLERPDEAAVLFGKLFGEDAACAEAKRQLHVAAKQSSARHKEAGTTPPEIVAVVMRERGEEAAAKKADQKEVSAAKDEEKRLAREADFQKTRDHFLVKHQVEEGNREGAIQNCMKFLSHPMMQQAPDEMKVQFLSSKGFSEEDAKEAIGRVSELGSKVQEHMGE